MKKFVGVLVCLLALMIRAGALADVVINAANFPDENFRQFVSQFDSNIDGILSNSEIQTVTEIDCSEKGIKDLKGIEYFTALTELKCGVNQLTSLDVSQNTALTSLDCWYNQLTSLNMGNIPLTELDCSYNKLESLDVGKYTALDWLNCTGNLLMTLDVSQNTALTFLHCHQNNLTSLDVSKCPKIVSLVKNVVPASEDAHWEYVTSDGEFTVDKTVKVIFEAGDDTSSVPSPTPTPAATPTPTPVPTEPMVTPFPTEPTALETSVTVKGVKYKLSEETQTATATGPEKKTAKTITIQATVNANGKDYKVTEIKASAFQKMTKLTKVTIGKNVKTIGKNAFYNCKKLKTIKINSKLLTEKKTGKNAFKGIYKKATITCPKGKAKTYKKWLTKKGVPKTAKIK